MSHECPICYEEDSDQQIHLLCGHAFHKGCINNWSYNPEHGGMWKSCPMCRTSLKPSDWWKTMTGEQLQWYSQKLLAFNKGSDLVQDAFDDIKVMDYDGQDTGISAQEIYDRIVSWKEQYEEDPDIYVKWRNIVMALNGHFGCAPIMP